MADPELKAEILAARRLLGKPIVTGAEIARLKSEGRLVKAETSPRGEPDPR